MSGSTWATSTGSCARSSATASSTPRGTTNAPGPAKRVYVITQSGRRVLAQWVEAFTKIERQIEQFRKRYTEQRG